MRLRSLILRNFRCFGPAAQRIEFANVTTIIGPNGTGKTAILQALGRLFGISKHERGLRRSDFYIPPKVNPETIEALDLMIEAELEFPELERGAPGGVAVPGFFRQMTIEGPGQTPYCRVRLDGKWTRSNLQDGDIDENLSWLLEAGEDIKDEHRRKVQAQERSEVHVLYVPAARGQQLRHASGTLLSRLLQAVEWSQEVRGKVKEASSQTTQAF
jgi:predicted ATP-dependent endonuclease of OLD family